MKKVLSSVIILFCACVGSVFAQQSLLQASCHLNSLPHNHVVVQGDWPDQAMIMCGYNKYMILEPKLIIRFGRLLKAYSMWVGPMYYPSAKYRIGRQYAVSYSSQRIRSDL